MMVMMIEVGKCVYLYWSWIQFDAVFIFELVFYRCLEQLEASGSQRSRCSLTEKFGITSRNQEGSKNKQKIFVTMIVMRTWRSSRVFMMSGLTCSGLWLEFQSFA